MKIVVDPSLHLGHDPSPHFRGIHHLVFVVLPPHGFITYDLLRKCVLGVITPEASQNDALWDSVLLPITVGILGTRLGVAPLHCACLDWNGDALLLAGHSGAGKSTLSAALAQRGFALVSEDWTYISRNSASPVAHGLLTPLKLLPDVVRFFPQLRGFVPTRTLNGEIAFEIEPQLLGGASGKRISRPRWIFFLERTTAPGCHFVPCRPEFLKHFFEESAERLPSELPDAQLTRSAIINDLSACPSWILRTSEGPMDTANALSRFALEAAHAKR